jgi:hypothetical protein
VHDGAPPPDREFIDPSPVPQGAPPKPQSAPAKPQGSTTREYTFASVEGQAGVGSILVSGESQTPVQPAFPQGALPSPAALGKPAPRAAEDQTASTPAAPNLAQFWRALRLGFTSKE